MAEPQDSCIGHWKLEDVTAEIGPDFVVNGVATWNPCKFNNGFYTTDDANFLRTANDGTFTPNSFIAEWWMRTDNSVTNGIPSDGGYHDYGIWGVTANPTILIANYPAPFECYIYIDTGVAPPVTFSFANGTWLAGANVHIMLVVDTTGIAGGPNTVRYYVNGNLENSSNGGLAAFVAADRFKIGGLPWAAVENMEAVMDNLRIYNGSSQALIDAVILNSYTNEIEEWPTVGGFPLIGEKLRSPLFHSNMLN
jgi:hypothetical protein